MVLSSPLQSQGTPPDTAPLPNHALTAASVTNTGSDARQRLPRVASINLCSDQLLLGLADHDQILTISWLAADPHESVFAEAASRFPLNYGSAEELMRYEPDVVLAGTLTGDHTRALLRRLGYRVVALPPADTLEDIFDNLALVADAIGQPVRGARIAAAMRARLATYEQTRPAILRDAVVIRPGGFTVGEFELANELMRIAGLRNVAADEGLDRWGSLAMETLLRSQPEMLIFNGYRADDASLANAVLEHPALAQLRESITSITVPTRYWACGLPQSLDSVSLMRAGPAA
jgi:iron complex transport system substrate-binding protein